ncbi:hypothetical protein Pcinc_014693 [Petrolisthes cinctipes]|uniref:Ionotropic glutamate receptor C-terminal domain-containing protein n=1 Tax=Petrolisthes cinctipes TaxID=88211 RepID=A0AAE1FWD0_PETCI|nr:hypothetical protein Pcinc_014693 [Petrolisthes cinctipes]
MALSGTHLRVAAEVWVPWVKIEQHIQVGFTTSGILIEFLDLFASKLNFTYSVVRPADREWGRILPNGTMTGMVGMCARQEADMALGPFSVTYMRSQFADFSEILYMDNFGIFLPRPRLERDLFSFVKPFPWEVWTVLLVLLMLSVCLGVVMKWLTNALNLPGTGSDLVFKPNWLFKLLLLKPFNPEPSLLKSRVIVGTWLVTSLILCTAYQGVLTSMLAAPYVNIPVNSLEDLVAYRHIPYAFEYGTALHQLFTEATSGMFKTVHDNAFQVTSLFEEWERIKVERFALLCDFFSMKKVMSDDYSTTSQCNFYIAKEAIYVNPMAFVFPKKSHLIPKINKWVGILKESGLFAHYISQYTSNATHCLVPPGPLVKKMVSQPSSSPSLTSRASSLFLESVLYSAWWCSYWRRLCIQSTTRQNIKQNLNFI